MFCGNFTLTRFDGIITKFDNLRIEGESGDRGDVAVSVQIRIYRLQSLAGDDASIMNS